MAEPLIDIRPDHLEIVRGILRKHVPQYPVWAFGSRVKWSAKEYSDLDSDLKPGWAAWLASRFVCKNCYQKLFLQRSRPKPLNSSRLGWFGPLQDALCRGASLIFYIASWHNHNGHTYGSANGWQAANLPTVLSPSSSRPCRAHKRSSGG